VNIPRNQLIDRVLYEYQNDLTAATASISGSSAADVSMPQSNLLQQYFINEQTSPREQQAAKLRNRYKSSAHSQQRTIHVAATANALRSTSSETNSLTTVACTTADYNPTTQTSYPGCEDIPRRPLLKRRYSSSSVSSVDTSDSRYSGSTQIEFPHGVNCQCTIT
jgi:hypothetical protein